MQNDEHLCLIAVIGVERPDKETLTVMEVRERETGWRLVDTDCFVNWRSPGNCIF